MSQASGTQAEHHVRKRKRSVFHVQQSACKREPTDEQFSCSQCSVWTYRSNIAGPSNHTFAMQRTPLHGQQQKARKDDREGQS